MIINLFSFHRFDYVELKEGLVLRISSSTFIEHLGLNLVY